MNVASILIAVMRKNDVNVMHLEFLRHCNFHIPLIIAELLSLVISVETAVADTFVVAFLTFVSEIKRRRKRRWKTEILTHIVYTHIDGVKVCMQIDFFPHVYELVMSFFHSQKKNQSFKYKYKFKWISSLNIFPIFTFANKKWLFLPLLISISIQWWFYDRAMKI